MATDNKTELIPCTFPDCNAHFGTRAQLKRHKRTTPEHDYCAICDQDFEDDQAFLVHKIESTKHIVCPICNKDFRSEEGQQLHLKQAHATEQNLRCVGCGEVFKRAGGLMGHIEKNKCSKITAHDFEKRRAQKEIIKVFLADPDEFNSPSHVISEAGDSDDGGVVLNLNGTSPASRKASHSASVVPPAISEKEQWPQLELQAFKNPDQDDLLTGVGSLAVSELTMTWGTDATAKLFPDAPKTPATVDWSAKALTEKDPNAERFHPQSKSWNPEMFRVAATGKYQCPWNACGKAFTNVFALEAHLLSPAHIGGDSRCPYCLKIFKTTTALVQHAESASTRCKIRETVHYGQAMDTFTGGLIETQGYHEDGSIKYKAVEPDW